MCGANASARTTAALSTDGAEIRRRRRRRRPSAAASRPREFRAALSCVRMPVNAATVVRSELLRSPRRAPFPSFRVRASCPVISYFICILSPSSFGVFDLKIFLRTAPYPGPRDSCRLSRPRFSSAATDPEKRAKTFPPSHVSARRRLTPALFASTPDGVLKRKSLGLLNRFF